MNAPTLKFWAKYDSGDNARQRPWLVIDPNGAPITVRWHGKRPSARRFKTEAAAQLVADMLNVSLPT